MDDGYSFDGSVRSTPGGKSAPQSSHLIVYRDKFRECADLIDEMMTHKDDESKSTECLGKIMLIMVQLRDMN